MSLFVRNRPLAAGIACIGLGIGIGAYLVFRPVQQPEKIQASSAVAVQNGDVEVKTDTLIQPTERASQQPEASTVSVKPKVRKIELPPIRLASSQSETNNYVGMAACAKCHDEHSTACLQTTHGRSFRLVDPALEPPDGEFFDAANRKRYRVYRKDNEFRHREILVGDNGDEIELADHAMSYVVGSGHLTSTYLVKRNEFLTESPITWYTSRSAWDFSPGYEKQNAGFARPVYMECLQCHTGQTLSVDGGRSRLDVKAMTIDCERCHGPGLRHVDFRESEASNTGTTAKEMDTTIVNPKWLSRQQSEDACALCHLQGESEAYLMGRSTQSFQPGHFLSDFRIDYAAKQPDDSMKIVGHVEQLHHSKCYQASPSMTCVTCHAPHRDPSTFDRVEVYRSKCLSCHNSDACGMPKPDRLLKSTRDSCFDCHMPPSPTDIPHVAAHHHRIGIHRDEESNQAGEQAATLVPIQDISHLPEVEQQRCLAMAYLALSKKIAQPKISQVYLQRANTILAPIVQSGVQDSESLAVLAQTYLGSEPQSAIRLAQFALERGDPMTPDTEVQLQFALSNSFLALRQIPPAIAALERLTQLRLQGGDWFLLAGCRYNTGNLTQALTAARRAVEIRPDAPNYQALLAELLTHLNLPEEASRHRELAKLLGYRDRK